MDAEFSTKKFFLILTGISIILCAITFHPTLNVPLSPEDLSVYLGYFHFTGDYNIPKCFYWNSFGVLPGEFVYKFGFDINDIGGAYRPLTTVVFALNFIMSGFNPATYHLTNILLHLITSLLIGYFVLLLTKRYSLSAFAAIFFLLNPLHSEQTIVIIQVSDILCTLFYTLTFILFWHYVQSNKTKFLLLAIISYILCIMGKEMAVTLPAMLTIAYPMLLNKFKFNLKYFKEAVKKVGIFWIIVFAYLLFRIIIFGSIGGYPGIYASHDAPTSPHTKIGLFMVYNIAEGINKLFLIPGDLLPSRYLWLLLLVLPLLLPFPRNLKFSILWIFISIAPISNLYLMSWYLYLPSVGFTSAIAILLGLFFDIISKITKQEINQNVQYNKINLRAYIKNPVLILTIFSCIILFALFHQRIQNKIEKYRHISEYSYNITNQFKEHAPAFPKGSNIYLIVNSMTQTDNNIDYNPALQFVMRIAYNDLYLNLIPVPLDTEFEYFLELNKAAILDITTITINDKSFFFDYSDWNLTKRDDIIENLKIRDEIKNNKTTKEPFFSWNFTEENQFDSWETFPNGMSLLQNKGLVLKNSNKQIDLRSPFEFLDSIFFDKVKITVKTDSQKSSQAYFYWKNANDDDYSENKKRTFTISPTDNFTKIEIPLDKDISWLTNRNITELRILFSPDIREVTLKKIQLH